MRRHDQDPVGIRLSHAFVVAALAALTLAGSALAQPGVLPRGNDDVVLARVYRKTPAGTDPIGRMGLIVSDKAPGQSLDIAAAPGQPAVTLELDTSRKGDGARVEWTLRGSGAESASGTLNLPPGALSRVTLKQWQGGELFASLEAGRASTFDVGRLSQHFGGVPWGMAAPAVETTGVAPVLMQGPGGGLSIVPASALAAAPSDRPKGPALEVQCPGGGAFVLSLDSGRGECRARFSEAGDGPVGATCADPEGNVAELDCRVQGRRGACIRTAGNGSCRQGP